MGLRDKNLSESLPIPGDGLPPQTRAERSDKILIFNFFDGVLLRGIPIYVRNLRVALELEGISCREVACPALLQRLPRTWLNLLFVLYEQLVMPIRGLACKHVIYPYNSVSILGSLMGKSLLVVHDFIPNSKRNKKFAARYIRMTQHMHTWLGGDVAYVSRSSERVGRTAGLFSRSRVFLFPNTFFSFMRVLRGADPLRGNHVLLCTGWGTNKDLPGALALYRDSELWKTRRLRILGIAGHEEAIASFCAEFPDVAAHITVLPRLEDVAVGNEYRSAAWIWVHSVREGYGRSIAEAKLCGCRIVASDIAPFREQRDEMVFLYSGLNRFLEACTRCEATKIECLPRELREHEVLRKEIKRFAAANCLCTSAKSQKETEIQ